MKDSDFHKILKYIERIDSAQNTDVSFTIDKDFISINT